MKNLKHYILSFILMAIVTLGVAVHVAKAGPLFFPVTTQTATATTTVSFLNAGTGTTTLSVNAYGSGTASAIKHGILLVQFAGSSTASTLKINKEYSQDNVDWYQDGGDFTDGFSTTTKPFDISQVNQYTFAFASSTAGLGSVPALQATTTRAINVQTPTKFIRFIFTLPVGSTNGAVWAQFVPVKEFPNNG